MDLVKASFSGWFISTVQKKKLGKKQFDIQSPVFKGFSFIFLTDVGLYVFFF